MENNFIIPNMQTIHRTAQLFNLPEYFVRFKVLSGEIVAVQAGRKYLVNIDKFADWLNTAHVEKQPEQVSGIRSIK